MAATCRLFGGHGAPVPLACFGLLLVGSVVVGPAGAAGGGDDGAVCDLIKLLNGVPWDAVDPMKTYVRRNATVASQSAAIMEIEVRKAYASVLRALGSQPPPAVAYVYGQFNKARRSAILADEGLKEARRLWLQLKGDAVKVVQYAETANDYLKQVVGRVAAEGHGHELTGSCNTRERRSVTADSLRNATQRALPFVKDPMIQSNLSACEKLLRNIEAAVPAAGAARWAVVRQVPLARAAGALACTVAIMGLGPSPSPPPPPPPPPPKPEGSEKPFFIILLASILLMLAVCTTLLVMAGVQYRRARQYERRFAAGQPHREFQPAKTP